LDFFRSNPIVRVNASASSALGLYSFNLRAEGSPGAKARRVQIAETPADPGASLRIKRDYV
jgi:hypothetical protein